MRTSPQPLRRLPPLKHLHPLHKMASRLPARPRPDREHGLLVVGRLRHQTGTGGEEATVRGHVVGHGSGALDPEGHRVAGAEDRLRAFAAEYGRRGVGQGARTHSGRGG